MINTYEYDQKNINQSSFYYFTFNNDIETYSVFNEDFKCYDEKELMKGNIILASGNSSGVVSWATRRDEANNLKFSKKDNTNIKVSDDLNQLFKKISNRNADFISNDLELNTGN